MTCISVCRLGRWGLESIFSISILTLICLPSMPSIAMGQDLGKLKVGLPVRVLDSMGEPWSYAIELEEGEKIRFELKQLGGDCTVELGAPDGKKRLQRDSSHLPDGLEEGLWVAELSGDFRFDISCRVIKASKYGFEFVVLERGSASEEDRHAVAAELVTDQAEAARLEQTAVGYQRAVDAYQLAAEHWRAAGEASWEAIAENSSGLMLRYLGRLDEAQDAYQRALVKWREAGEPNGEAMSLVNLGGLEEARGDLLGALHAYDKAMPKLRALGDWYGELITLRRSGGIWQLLGEIENAETAYQASIELSRNHGSKAGESSALNKISVLRMQAGRLQEAIEISEQALGLKRELQDFRGEAAVLVNLGVFYRKLGSLDQSVDNFELALASYELLGDQLGVLSALTGIGKTHKLKGNSLEARRVILRILEQAEELGAGRQRALALQELGDLELLQGAYKKARQLLDFALQLFLDESDRQGEGQTRALLAKVHGLLGHRREADQELRQALRLARESGERSLEASVLGELGFLARSFGDLEEACGYFSEAIGVIESMRDRFTRKDLQSQFFSSRIVYRDAYVNALMELHEARPSAGYDASALEVSEAGRGRRILDHLREMEAYLRRGVDPEILEEAAALRRELNAEDYRRRQLSGLDQKEKELESAERINDLVERMEVAEARIRSTNVAYQQLSRATSSYLDIQQSLDDQTLLLQLHLAEDRSFLWLVSERQIESRILPGKEKIEALVQDLQTAIPRSRSRLGRSAFEKAALELGELVLSPVADFLGSQRIIIVPDDGLHTLPFGLLASPGQEEYEPILLSHDIVISPSASILGVLRNRDVNRSPAENLLAVVADPVFDLEDPRFDLPIVEQKGSKRVHRDLLGRSLLEVGINQIRRLPSTSKEADAIVAIAKPVEVLQARGFDATSEFVVRGEALRNHRIIHFATHGLVNPMHPELSGLILSLFDSEGKALDGFLRMHDLIELDLNADLVVLSACLSAVGRETRREGPVSLVSGFLFAGSSAVIGSLWAVEDAATAELMSRFYRALLQEQIPPAAALRSAQISMWQDPSWKAPYYWAGFVFQGDWDSF